MQIPEPKKSFYDPGLPKSRIQRSQILVAPYEKKRPHQQHHRHRYLCHHHCPLYPESMPIAHYAAFARSQRGHGIRSRTAHGRKRSTEDAGCGAHGRGKQQHSPIRGNYQMNRVSGCIQRCNQSSAQRLSQRDSKSRSEKGKQCALNQHLAQQPSPGSPQRHADCDLSLPAARSREHQVCQVGTSNQQH